MFTFFLPVVLLALGLPSAVSGRADCSSLNQNSFPHKKYTVKSFHGICYQFFATRHSFHKAENVCNSFGSTLVLAKNNYVISFLSKVLRTKRNDAEYWIGLSDRRYEGVYEWMDGDSMNINNFARGEGKLGFYKSEQEYEDCVAMDYSGLWYDYSCDERKKFICEFNPKQANTSPRPRTITTRSTTTLTKPTGTTTKSETITSTLQITLAETTQIRQQSTSDAETTHITQQSTSDAETTLMPQTTPTITTIQQTGTTHMTTQITTDCPPFHCVPELDCGLDGYKADPITNCLLCECGI